MALQPKRLPTRCRSRGAGGFATLEWLLVVAAAGGFAAAMTAGVDQLIARQVTPPRADAHVAHVESRVAAARINDQASAALTAAHTASAAGNTDRLSALEAQLDALRHRCEALPEAYPASVEHASWDWLPIPLGTPAVVDDESDAAPGLDNVDDRAAIDGRWVCAVTGPVR